MSEISTQEMLEAIKAEAAAREYDDAEWIVDTYNHLFGTDYNIGDY